MDFPQALLSICVVCKLCGQKDDPETHSLAMWHKRKPGKALLLHTSLTYGRSSEPLLSVIGGAKEFQVGL